MIILQDALNTGIDFSGLILNEIFRQFTVTVVLCTIECGDRLIAETDQSCFARYFEKVVYMRVNRA